MISRSIYHVVNAVIAYKRSMVMKKNKKIPKVFVSYSHDGSKHRQWVGWFASKLVEKGVDVIFDQWDLGPGDDIPKFRYFKVHSNYSPKHWQLPTPQISKHSFLYKFMRR